MAESIPREVLLRWEREYGLMRYRSQKDTRRPCAVCGWAEHMAIHRPITTGPRAGQPYGHAYEPLSASSDSKGDATND